MPAAGEFFLGIIKARSHQPAAGGKFLGYFKAKTAFLFKKKSTPGGPKFELPKFCK